MQRLILFDVDQTLISTRGGDRKALNTTFQELHCIDDAFEGINFGGRMDLSIMDQVYSHWGVAEGDRSLGDFKARYFELLEKVLKDWEMGIVYPGIPELLKALDSRAGVQMGLATGNFRESAFIKLRKYGLDTFFEEGGFGGDHPNRPEVVADAIVKCQTLSGRVYEREDIFVIGDSISDVEAGRANGINSVAVATGHYDTEKLKSLGPTFVFEDLFDTERVLGALLG